MKITLIQLNSQNDKQENLRNAEKLILQAVNHDKPDIIALPEMWVCLGGSLEEKKKAAENFAAKNSQDHPAYSLMQQLAKKYNIFIHCGSMIEVSDDHFFNTTVVFNSQGQEIVKYRKINLFQTNLANGINYDETKFFSAGKGIATFTINNITVGCAICYDLRFSNIFQQLIKQQVKIIIIPAAFTALTGQAHWELLCRSRAIETQSFIIAPAQTGTYFENGVEKKSWGHSMVVNPWGEILINAQEKVGFFTTNLDFNFLDDIRQRLPILKKTLNT